MQRIQQTLAVKVQRSDAEQDVAVALVEQAMDQKDGDQIVKEKAISGTTRLSSLPLASTARLRAMKMAKKDSLPTSSGTLMAVAMYASLVKDEPCTASCRYPHKD